MIKYKDMAEAKDFRIELRDTRILLNISQADFAAQLGISAKHLNRIENCHVYPSWPLFFEMANTLGYKMELKFDLANT